MVGAYPNANGLASEPSLPIVFQGPPGGASPFPSPQEPAQAWSPKQPVCSGPTQLVHPPECSDTAVGRLTLGQGPPRTLALVPCDLALLTGIFHCQVLGIRCLVMSGNKTSHRQVRVLEPGPARSASGPPAFSGRAPGTPGLSDQALRRHRGSLSPGVCSCPGCSREGCL